MEQIKYKKAVVRMGIDISKHVFQLHGVDNHEKVALRKKANRKEFLLILANTPPCLIGMEACATSHYWARELKKFGHEVKLIPAQHVKPYVQNNKNDARDAEAICEAVSRPRMRFVCIKSTDQQDIQMLHRIRQGLIKTRTAQANQIRGLLAEYGIIINKGIEHICKAMPTILEDGDNNLSGMARNLFNELYETLCKLDNQIEEINTEMERFCKSNESCKNLQTIIGVGPVVATGIYAAAGNASQFKTGRDMSAWLGLVPRQHSTGGKEVHLGISKKGDRYLRSMIVQGAWSVVQRSGKAKDETSKWIREMISRSGKNKTVIAVANKLTRIMCAVLKSGEPYRVAA